MSTVTIPVQNKEHPHLRAMNVFRDLTAVADLIELCFAGTMDNDGQRYVSDMRRAGRDSGFLQWANRMAETTSLPLTGYVWEENHRIIGNASLIPFRDKGKRIYLIANVATHPDFRRRGIARLLTQSVMEHARAKQVGALWLHVRDDNPGAIKLYEDLGFQDIARRTTWTARPDSLLTEPDSDIQIVPRHPRFWQAQQDWLRRLHPDELAWYRSFNFNSLRPGLMNWLYLLFVDVNIKQWAAVRNEELLAALAWTPHGGRSESLYPATRPAQSGVSGTSGVTNADEAPIPEALTRLLIHARRVLSHQSTLSLEYPAGEMTDALHAAGFTARRTLIWMRA
jgi:ribosomal protein S18 acetylase RimI-like enzyme